MWKRPEKSSVAVPKSCSYWGTISTFCKTTASSVIDTWRVLGSVVWTVEGYLVICDPDLGTGDGDTRFDGDFEVVRLLLLLLLLFWLEHDDLDCR